MKIAIHDGGVGWYLHGNTIFFITIYASYSLSGKDANLCSFLSMYMLSFIQWHSKIFSFKKVDVTNTVLDLLSQHWSSIHVKIGYCWRVKRRRKKGTNGYWALTPRSVLSAQCLLASSHVMMQILFSQFWDWGADWLRNLPKAS